jgi:hypothetical protein
VQNGLQTMQPLTHHDILALVGPFARGGRQVDLPASDRASRRLAFKPIDRPALPTGTTVHDRRDSPLQDSLKASLPETLQKTLQETLQLEDFGAGQFRLTRQLSHPCGLAASLRAAGPDPAELLAGVDAVPPHSQFRFGPGWAMALSQRLGPGAGGPQAQAVLLQGELRVAGLTLTLAVSAVAGVSGEITLTAADRATPAFPQDLLAVLGWDWARLVPKTGGWHSRVKLRRREPARSADARAKLERAAEHLVRTLAEPPARFHESHVGARWGVVLRRSIPVLTLALLALGLLGLAHFNNGQEGGAWVLLIHVPTLLLAISFRLQELAQFEFPPLPRRLQAASWCPTAVVKDATIAGPSAGTRARAEP